VVPKVNGQNIQFIIVQPLYESKTKKDKDADGNKILIETTKFIKENYLKVWMSKNDIGAFGEYVGSKGRILKSRTKIFNRLTNTYQDVAHSLKEMEQVMMPDKIGFKNQ
jgi:hypothetical protein